MTEKQEAKRIEHLREEEARRDEAALRFLLSDERGRWFLSRMMERCNVHSIATGDVHQILMFEGARRVGVELYDNLRMLVGIDESGECLEKIHIAEMEYGRFMARYKKGEATQ